MLLLSTLEDLRRWRADQSPQTRVVFVPTMGALHEGHLDLMRAARDIATPQGRVVVSIFVNPTQFGPKEDFSKYPRDLEGDSEKCRSVGVDAIFAPTADAIYAKDASLVVLETSLSKGLCGASRAGHFDGVCLVVLKLFNLVQPDTAVFGKKDYQQLAIIKRMVRDLNVPVAIVGCETVREADGLAMSSRNRYLNEAERQQAAAIRQGLLRAQQAWRAGAHDALKLISMFKDHLIAHAPLHRLDYIECVDRDTLAPQSRANENSVLATAVFFGATRLIDNLELA
jgi:pantoate--beta-alanine ligase